MTSYRWSALEEKGPPPEKQMRRMPNKMLLQHLGLSVLASLALVVIFGAAGMAPRPLWFVVTALAVGLVSLAIRLMLPHVLETSWPGRHDHRTAGIRTQSSDTRTQFLATWLQESGRERRAGEGSQTFVRRIRPLLLELATDRLVHRHGIDPAREPDRARAIVGDRHWALISGDDRRTASLGEIEDAIHTIENL